MPTPSGLNLTQYTPILINKRRYSYKRNYDNIQAKLVILDGKQVSHLYNISGHFLMNDTGSFTVKSYFNTDRYGTAHINVNTSGIPSISCCLGEVHVDINGIEYTSNVARFNFN